MGMTLRRRIIKREVRETMRACYGELFPLSLTLLFFMAGEKAFFSCLQKILSEYLEGVPYHAVSGLLFFAVCLLTAPLLCGAAGAFSCLCGAGNGESSQGFARLFSFYRSPERFRCACGVGLFAAGLFVLFRLPAALVALWRRSLPEAVSSGASLSASAGTVCFGVGLLLLFCVLCLAVCEVSVMPVILGRYELSFGAALRLTHRCMKGLHGEWIVFQLSFLPLFLLSYASFGVLLFLFTLPYYALSVCGFAAYADCRRFAEPFSGVSAALSSDLLMKGTINHG